MYVKCNVYLPKDGRYSAFSGPLKLAPPPAPPRRPHAPAPSAGPGNVQKEAARIQQAVDNRLRRAAPAGVTPIKVTLPTSGTVKEFKKVLALDEALWIEMDYTHWPGYKKGWFD
jgi:hypothetical protein